tara:strand:- start:91 stop:732 length:642 start_codon:yes stop_codon:yes gene_type:complete
MDKNTLEIKIPIEDNLEDCLNIGIFDDEQLKRFVESALFNPHSFSMYNSINDNQRKCKKWLLDTISIKSPGSILVLGGWYGGIAAMLKRKYGCLVRCIDIDPDCKRVGRKIYNDFIQFRSLDFIDYPIEKKYHDLIVSTSCEHFKKEDLLDFIDRAPEGITFCLQSNNYFGIDGHINCSSSLEEFVEYLPFKSYWAGELSLEKYNRFMVIGTK